MSESRDLILELMGDLGMTQAEIARHIGRSPDMVRLVRTEKRPGNNLTEALRELRTTGRVSFEHVPPRRRGHDGKIVPVRAPMKDWKPTKAKKGEKPSPRPTAVPEDPTAKEQRGARRNRYAVDRQVFRGGARRIDLHSPKKPDAKGRKAAEETIMAELRSVTRSQSARNRINPETGKPYGGKVTKFYATFENGRRVELGGKNGYQSSTVLRQAKAAGGFFEWMDEEMQKGRPDEYLSKFAGKRIVNIEMSSFYQSEQAEGTKVHRKTSIHG